MSIFLKECPQCAGSNPSDELFCRCGYCFDPSQVNNHDDALTHVANEEQNYLEYLTARITQVQSELEAKLAAQMAAPKDATLAAEVLLAQQALSSVRAERKLQAEKVEALKRQRKTMQRKVRASKPAVHPAPAAKLLNGRAKPGKSPVTAPPAAAAKPVFAKLLKAESKKPVLAAPQKSAAPVPAARPAKPAKPVAPAIRTVPAAPAAAAPVPVQRPAAAIHQTRVTEIPRAAFHAAQSAKAEKVIAREPPAPVAAPVPSLAPLNREVSWETEAPALTPVITHPNTQECPNCMAKLPLGTGMCRCGFDLTAKFEMPALSLSAADRALLFSKLDYGS
jgi:hypothetical protein